MIIEPIAHVDNSVSNLGRTSSVWKRSILWGALTGLLAVPTYIVAQSEHAAPSSKSWSDQEARGKHLFLQNCSLCHLATYVEMADWKEADSTPRPVGPRLGGLLKGATSGKPSLIRTFGLPGQEPGSTLPVPTVGLHTVLSTGPKGNRVYFAHGNAENGLLEIVDREKLLNGPKEPTEANLRAPVITRLEMPPDVGVHTAFPLFRMPLPEFAKQKSGAVKDFIAITGQGHNDNEDCREVRQMLHMFDTTTESKPLGVSTWTVPEASGNFCSRGSTFGTHSTNESFSPIYYKRVVFVAHHNAGVRALDIRDPYNPKEIGYYIPAITEKTEPSCYVQGADRQCKTEIDTNNVEVDDRGYIYIVDFAGTGMHILELIGTARKLADFSQVH